VKKDIAKSRLKAAWCWKFSSQVNPLTSSAMRELEDIFGSFMEQDAETSVPTFEQVSQKCDELIMVNDASTRIMVLTSMFLMHYISPHVDIIASLLDSEEEGDLYDWLSGRKLDENKSLGKQAKQYLLWVLNIEDTYIFAELKKKIDHWSGVLGYGYSHDDTCGPNLEELCRKERENFLNERYRALDEIQADWDMKMAEEDFRETFPDPFYQEEEMWAPNPPIQNMFCEREEYCIREINGISQLVIKYLNDEEYREKKEKSQRESWEHFRQDILSYVERCLETSFIEDKRREVRGALEKISRYAFCEEKDMSKVAHVLSLLNQMVGLGNFPANWLLDIVKDIFQPES